MKKAKRKTSTKAKKKAKKAKRVLGKPQFAEKKVGRVTHYFGKIRVGIIKPLGVLKIGVRVHIRGAHTDFYQNVDSMQFDHKPVLTAKKGKEIGIKVSKKVREGDAVYLAKS